METVSNLSEAQRLALAKLKALVGEEQVDHILAQGPDTRATCTPRGLYAL